MRKLRRGKDYANEYANMMLLFSHYVVKKIQSMLCTRVVSRTRRSVDDVCSLIFKHLFSKELIESDKQDLLLLTVC